MDKKYKKLPLRKGVGIVILNKKNQIFVAKRIDNPKNFWQCLKVESIKMKHTLWLPTEN